MSRRTPVRCLLVLGLVAVSGVAQAQPEKVPPVRPATAPAAAQPQPQTRRDPAPQPERTTKPGERAEAASDLDDLLTYMTGSFSSQEQSKADPDYFDIRLQMVQIWKERNDGKWLYVEQAAATTLDKPYRQRIYHVTQLAPGAFKSEVFELPGDPLGYAGAYKDPAKLKDLSPEKLLPRDGCSLNLHRSQDGTFNGATTGNGCASTLRGAAYATSEAHIGPDGLRTWDRGYDKDAKQVWGAEKGPYQFKRVD